ncbi:MAG: branched-chain amino acid ABC transporter permease [Planctomycetales bacterium]|nr:branched-chain amino acid ABC transporter permease [Planctomycetales bacterium]
MRRPPIGVLVVAAAVLYPAVHAIGIGPSLGGLVTILFFTLLAVGLNIVVGYAGILHLGYAAFFGVGAYAAGILTTPSHPFGWPFWLALPVGGAAGALLGLVFSAPLLRLRGDYLAIVTLGLGEILQVVLINLPGVTRGNSGLSPIGAPRLLGYELDQRYPAFWYYFVLALLLLAVAVSRAVERSRFGRAWVAIRENELAADCMGVNPVRAKLLAFVLSAVVAGVAGAAYGSFAGGLYPTAFTFNISATLLCMVILGGMGNPAGVVLGAVLLAGFDRVVAPFLTEQAGRLLPGGGGGSWRIFLEFHNYRFLLYGIALVILMRIRPQGLLPSAEMREELLEREEAASAAGAPA